MNKTMVVIIAIFMCSSWALAQKPPEGIGVELYPPTAPNRINA
jgi:hypothetical protein